MYTRYLLTALIMGLMNFAMADSLSEGLLDIQHEWAHVNYQLQGKEQQTAFEELAAKADAFKQAHSQSAEALIWNGIVYSSYAGAKGGLGALKLAKNARKLFEEAIAIDPSALNGSAYTSLGTLYYKVPGFPLSFGSKKKAEENLLKALEINPDGIDPNYFYGDYLIEVKRYDEAIKVLEKALAAPDRPERPLADQGRRIEIQRDLDEARAHTN